MKPSASRRLKMFEAGYPDIYRALHTAGPLRLLPASMGEILVLFLRLYALEKEAGALSGSKGYLLMDAKNMLHTAYYRFEQVARFDPWRFVAIRPPPELQNPVFSATTSLLGQDKDRGKEVSTWTDLVHEDGFYIPGRTSGKRKDIPEKTKNGVPATSLCSVEELWSRDFERFKGIYPPLRWDRVLYKYAQMRYVPDEVEQEYAETYVGTSKNRKNDNINIKLDYKDAWRVVGKAPSSKAKTARRKNWVLNFGAADGECGYLYSWNHDLANCLLTGSVWNNWPVHEKSRVKSLHEAWHRNRTSDGAEDLAASVYAEQEIPNVPVFNMSGLVVEALEGNRQRLRRQYAGNKNVVYYLNTLALEDIEPLMIDMVEQEGFSLAPLLFKLDIDHMDCAMMENVLASGVRPLVLFVEARSVEIPLEVVSEAGTLFATDYANAVKAQSGCSLSGFVEVGLRYDYFLVEVLNDDAVFVRKDIFFDPDAFEDGDGRHAHGKDTDGEGDVITTSRGDYTTPILPFSALHPKAARDLSTRQEDDEKNGADSRPQTRRMKKSRVFEELYSTREKYVETVRFLHTQGAACHVMRHQGVAEERFGSFLSGAGDHLTASQKMLFAGSFMSFDHRDKNRDKAGGATNPLPKAGAEKDWNALFQLRRSSLF
ncbi:unnamed protein product [Amoebophrya sp. A25]|nr:unnamed protein product [Amoebophrya sp. A25]|eukprot:GSA25T00023062001.1